MQVELSKSEDVKFSSFRPSTFQNAFYGLIRTDMAMLLIDFLSLPIRCIYSDFQIAILGHDLFWYQTVQPLYMMSFFFLSFLQRGLSGVLLVETGFLHKLVRKSRVPGRNRCF